MHRDLKPSNCMVNSNCDLKLIDFGMARSVSEFVSEFNNEMTVYCTTRYYRAPENVLTSKYSSKIDVWSAGKKIHALSPKLFRSHFFAGCILAEMNTRKVLFKGNDYIDQLNEIFSTIGTPSSHSLEKVCDKDALAFVQKLEYHPKKDLSELFAGSDPSSVQLIEKMLSFDPEERFSVEEAISHPFLHSFHDPQEEPLAQSPLSFHFEEQELSLEKIHELIDNEIEFCSLNN